MNLFFIFFKLFSIWILFLLSVDIFLTISQVITCNNVKKNVKTVQLNGLKTSVCHSLQMMKKTFLISNLSNVFEILLILIPMFEYFRPLHLPYQCVLTVGNFSLSSNIVARSKASTLQIVSEDVALFISAHLSKSENLDLMSHYICVMDLGVFELFLKLSKNSKQSKTTSQPEVDLRMAVNVIHIRTCADSAFALCRLISYLASDGDKISVEEQTTEFEGVVEHEEPVLLDQADSDNNSLSSLIMEAMHEETTDVKKLTNPLDTVPTVSSINSSFDSPSTKGVEVFYFPDETNSIITPFDFPPPVQIDDEYIEKEFCFVEHEAGSGVMVKNIKLIFLRTEINFLLTF